VNREVLPGRSHHLDKMKERSYCGAFNGNNHANVGQLLENDSARQAIALQNRFRAFRQSHESKVLCLPGKKRIV